MSKNKNKTDVRLPNSHGGIVITDSISLKISNTSSVLPKIFLMITAFAGLIGFSASLITIFKLDCYVKPLYFALISQFVLISLLFVYTSKAKLLLIPIFFLTALGIYKTTDDFVNGYGVFVNSIMHNLNLVEEEYSYYLISDSVDQKYCLTLFLFFLLTIINSIICYNTLVKPRFVFDFCCTFPFIEIGMYFGYVPSYKPFFLLISYWIAVFAMRAAGNQYHSNTGQPVFIRKNNMFISSGNLRNNVIEKIGIITLISSMVILLSSDIVLNTISYQRPDKVKMKRSEIISTISELSSESIKDFLTSKAKKNPSLGKSKLGNLDHISFENKTDMTILISDKVSENLYIKGFTGGYYKDNTWWELPDNIYSSNQALFNKFDENECRPQDFLSINNKVLEAIYPERFQKRHAIIKTDFANASYMFTPYGTERKKEFSYIKDTGIKSPNNQNYAFSFITTPDIYKDISLINNNILSLVSDPNIYESEKFYNSFVFDNYLDLPDNDDIRKMKEMFSYIPKFNGANMQEISDMIRNILHSSADYSLHPGKTPSGKDMAYYMITESHKGYCSYFATAAILLARMSGIPARYSEGYVIIPDDFSNAEIINSYYEINIKDTRSHAWAEFYITGYGWVPFEFTPGYSNGIISAEEPDNPELTRNVSIVTEPQPVPEITVTVPVPEEHEDITAETTAPEVTSRPEAETTEEKNDQTASADGDHGSGSNDGPPDKKQTDLGPFTVVILIVLLSAGTILYINIRHETTVSKRKDSFRNKSNRNSITNIYSYITELLLDYGISKGNMLPLEFAEYAEENAKNIAEPGEISGIINIVLKSGYSNSEPSDSEVNKAIITAEKLARNIFKSKSRSEQIKFRYIKNLIK